MRYLVCSGRVYLFIGQLEMQTAHSVVVVYRSQLAISLMCKRLRRAGKEEAFKCLTAENLFEICIYLFFFFFVNGTKILLVISLFIDLTDFFGPSETW